MSLQSPSLSEAEIMIHRREVLKALANNQEIRDTMAYSLAFASAEGSKFPPLESELTPTMNEQLRISHNQLKSANTIRINSSQSKTVDDAPLPKTLSDALRPNSRAIVITETARPFRIFDVNKAWEGLCGYTFEESNGKELGDLLGGPETDIVAISALLNQLSRGEEATTVLTNYTKSGRKFQNRLHVGPLFDSEGGISHYVGVLQEV